MNVIYVGGIPPKQLQEKVKDWGSATDFAGYTLQSAIVSGLDKYYHNMKVLTSLWIETYPKSSKLMFRRQLFSHKNDKCNNDVFLGFVNLPIIKKITQFVRLKRELKNLVHEGEENIVISYALTSHSLLAIRSFCKYSKTCVIVPDLPQYMSEKRRLLYRIAKSIDRLLINQLLKKIDSFVLLSSYMHERLPIGNKPWIQMEGIYNSLNDPPPQEKDSYKVILYTGNLGKRYGIIDLLDAFSLIDDPKYRLWIRGNGETLPIIQERMKIDSRIVYYEPMSKEELLALHKQATLLINPIHKSKEFTKYFFPSKTMEYMASGTPTLMSRLACLPKEYEEYLFFFDDESIYGMRDKIIEICNKPSKELEEFGERASMFIIQNKNAFVQTKKIVDLIDKLN